MKEQDNVYDDTTRAEETTAVSNHGENMEAEQPASTVPRKFKDVDALVRAYSSLQAEFTRRSQRLKELEKQAENFDREKAHVGDSGVEKLRKNALQHKEENRQFAQFVSETMQKNGQTIKEETPSSEPASQQDQPSVEVALQEESKDNGHTMYEMNDQQGQMPAHGEGRTEGASTWNTGENGRASTVTSEGQPESFEALYERASRNEEVRLKIIGEYLSSLGKPSVPLMAGSVGVLATPPKRAKDISDAGNMALLYFRKPKA
ncbi:MAG: hypothetical protein IJW96_05355 [Clostridia bacterium]|nr:hypothetical protein [Clostridia bacterium]